MNLISCLSLNCSVLSHDWEVIVVRLREERKESTAMQGSKEPYDISAAEDEINRRMCEGYIPGKHPAVPSKKEKNSRLTLGPGPGKYDKRGDERNS